MILADEAIVILERVYLRSSHKQRHQILAYLREFPLSEKMRITRISPKMSVDINRYSITHLDWRKIQTDFWEFAHENGITLNF